MRKPNKVYFKMMSFIHETLNGWFKYPYKALESAGCKTGYKVVEIGCGSGFFTIPAAKTVGEIGNVLAIDVNPLAVRHVRKKVKTENISNVTVKQANASKTDLPDHSIDLALLFGVIHPIGDMEDIWIELYRVLQNEGILSIQGRLRPPYMLFCRIKRKGRIIRYRKNNGRE